MRFSALQPITPRLTRTRAIADSANVAGRRLPLNRFLGALLRQMADKDFKDKRRFIPEIKDQPRDFRPLIAAGRTDWKSVRRGRLTRRWNQCGCLTGAI